MKKLLAAIALILLIGVGIWYVVPTKEQDDLERVRIGWQIPLATQGQLVQVLKNTDILERNGFEGEFVPFSFGSPQVEAAAGGSLDVIFVGDQPALNLIAKGAPWKLTSQLFETRVAILVPYDSELTLGTLKGKIVASPFGSVAHREAVLFERQAGLDPEKDVSNINLDILEISSMVQSGKDWGNIDAVAVWEPSVTLFETRKLAKPVAETKTLGVVAASNAFLTSNANAEKLNRVVTEAWQYLLANRDQANQWYIADTKLTYTPEFLNGALAIDRNGAKSAGDAVSIQLTDKDREALMRGLEWAKDGGYIDSVPRLDQIVYAHKK